MKLFLLLLLCVSIAHGGAPKRSKIMCNLCKLWTSLFDYIFEVPQVDGKMKDVSLCTKCFLLDCIAALGVLTCKVLRIDDTRACKMIVSNYRVKTIA